MGVDDFEDYLSVEIKSEMAQSYFGFRKLIEDDSLEYREKVRQYSFILEKRISFDLIRIYILLQHEELIDTFLDLCRLNKRLFYDPYLTESTTIRQRLFESVRMRGLSRKGRFQNFLLDCYDRLSLYVKTYRKKYGELQELRGEIVDQIQAFEKKHDMAAIMVFLQSLGAERVDSNMERGSERGVAQAIASRMKIEVPENLEYHLPALPELPDYRDIKHDLLRLAEQAYVLQDEGFLVLFANKFFKPRP